MNRQNGRAPHIDEIKYHIYMQMKYMEYYAEIDKKLMNFLGNGEIFVQLWIPYSLLKLVLLD